MITKEIKAEAIAKLMMGICIEDVAIELDLPVLLVKEWHYAELQSEQNRKDGALVQVAANIHAVQNMVKQTLLEPSSRAEEILKARIEEVAVEITEQVSLNLTSTDVIRAKTLQLCADTVTKLYNSIISKTTGPDGSFKPNSNGMSAFKSLQRD